MRGLMRTYAVTDVGSGVAEQLGRSDECSIELAGRQSGVRAEKRLVIPYIDGSCGTRAVSSEVRLPRDAGNKGHV